MEIVIDKRIELLTIVQTLCNYWDNISLKHASEPLYQCKYKEDIKEYFGKHKNHEIFDSYNIFINDIRDISAPIKMALCYSNPPELINIASKNKDNFLTTYNSTYHHEEFMPKLRKFYMDTNFEQFYQKSKNEYIKLLGDYGNKAELSLSIALDYLGYKIENFNIIISPLVMGGFGLKVKTDNNGTLHYTIISPFDHINNKYNFGPLQFKKEMVWHEIGHPAIGDLTKHYVNQFSITKKKAPEIFLDNFYTSIENITEEYIIRAITIRLVEMNGGLEIMEFPIEVHAMQGFKDVLAIKDFIKENCEENGKLIKDSRYKKLVEYVLEKI